MNDDDRDTAMNRLRDAVGRGQLDLTEFVRRSDEVVRATSADDLSAAVVNLPLDPAARDAAERREYWGEWRWWLAGAIVLTAVWGFQGLGDGDFGRFWPVVPLGIWAAVLLALPLLPRDD